MVNIYEDIYLYVIHLTREKKGHAYLCDFCETALEDDDSIHDIRVGGWYPDEGFIRLWSKLAPDEPVPTHDPNSEQRIESLLASTKSAISPNRAEVGHGLIIGLVTGIVLSFAISHLLIVRNAVTTNDPFKVYFLGVIVGAVLGAIIGAVGQFILWRPRVARRKIRTACRNYSVHSDNLLAVADFYRGPVRRAAIRVAGELP